MYSESVCQVACSWVDMGSFHTRLFRVVCMTCGDFYDGSEKGTANVHHILCQSWEKCHGDPHNDSTSLRGPKLELCAGVSMACLVQDWSHISWRWRTHMKTQKLHNSWNCLSGLTSDHSQYCWGGGNWLWDMPTGSDGRIENAPCRRQICVQGPDRWPEAAARQSLHWTSLARLRWLNPLVQVITGDESWVYDYDLETKQQSSQWNSPTTSRPKMARQLNSDVNSMIITFLTSMGLCTKNLSQQAKLWIPGSTAKFAETAWKRAKTSPQTLARTDLAASPWQRPVSHFRPHPPVSGEKQNGCHPPPTTLPWFGTLWRLPISKNEIEAERTPVWYNWGDTSRIAESAWHFDRKGLLGSVPKMEETVGPMSTCGRELLRGWRQPIGLIVSFTIFTVSPESFGYHLILPLVGRVFPLRYLHSSVSTAHLLQPVTPRNCNASLWTTSSLLFLAFPTAPVSGNFSLRIFFLGGSFYSHS